MIKYTVSEKDRTVVATMEGCGDDMVRRISKMAGMAVYDPMDKLKIRDTFQSKAKCHPDDEFSEETGKAIAKKRLLNKYHEACIKALNRYEDFWPDFGNHVSQENQRILDILKKFN